MTNKDNSIWCE